MADERNINGSLRPSKSKEAAARDERLGQALRANLKRRKEQIRGRASIGAVADVKQDEIT